MIIIGIDPGLRYTGFGIVQKEGRKALLLDYGYLSMSSTDTVMTRIGIFYDFFNTKITTWSATTIAIETPFLGKNAHNFLKLGYLRGIIYLLAHQYTIPVTEFSPTQVKASITGYGGATKEQVARIIVQLFPGMEIPKKEDVTDALAVTLCGLWSHSRNKLHEYTQ